MGGRPSFGLAIIELYAHGCGHVNFYLTNDLREYRIESMPPTTQVKHFCVSCGQNLNIYALETLGACDHGLLCQVCKEQDSECPLCAKAEEDRRDVCVCCAHGQHGSHLIGGAKCGCMCHPSNQRERKAETIPALVGFGKPARTSGIACIGNGLYVRTRRA